MDEEIKENEEPMENTEDVNDVTEENDSGSVLGVVVAGIGTILSTVGAVTVYKKAIKPLAHKIKERFAKKKYSEIEGSDENQGDSTENDSEKES